MTDKKIIVITGCSTGVGLETAALLAKEKNFKVIATMRNLKKKEALEEAAGNTLNKSLFIQELDVSKEDSIMKFVDATFRSEGRVDILINNAATGQFCAFESLSVKQMQDLFQTNVFGTCKLTQEVLRKMKERKSGHIIFISSIGGVMPFPFSDFYVGTKFAIEGIAGSLAPVLRHFNISVTCVEPGGIRTAFGENISKNNQGGLSDPSADEKSAALLQNWVKEFSSHPFQTSQEVAEVIKGCILQEKPPVRIQTSEAVTARAKMVLTDTTGVAVTDSLAKMLAPQ